MNTTGFLRGYMAKNMSAESFIKVVAEALAREFEEEVNTVSIIENEYEIWFASINTELINELKTKSPYAVDKYLLQEFSRQGFRFDESRSQYIKYCLL